MYDIISLFVTLYYVAESKTRENNRPNEEIDIMVHVSVVDLVRPILIIHSRYIENRVPGIMGCKSLNHVSQCKQSDFTNESKTS